MTTDIKQYKQLLTIELKDGTILNSERTREEFEQFLQTAPDFITVDGILFNKYQFKKAYHRKIDGIEDFILSQPTELKKTLKKRQEEMKSRSGREWKTIEEVQNYIDHLKSKENK